MIQELQLRLSPEEAASENILHRRAASVLHISTDDIHDLRVVRRSIDSRRRDITINMTVAVAWGNDVSAIERYTPETFAPLPEEAPSVVVVGAGPAGLFASLELISKGIRPILLERGKDVDSRRLDIVRLNRTGEVDKDSNYCFGEGGAGTFSDGKLYTRSKKRGDNLRVMRLLVDHGASETILAESHPHIGSDRLPHIIKSIRKTIEACGGEVRFSTRAESLILERRDTPSVHNTPETQKQVLKACGVRIAGGEEIRGEGVILANGHSARDFLRSLYAQGVDMQPKGFAMGVRLEHPSRTIDRIQYHNPDGRGEWLPAAEYNFVAQSEERGVYSFCMCPGGVVVPAVSAPGESVVNGMSASSRSGKWSNSGMVVEIRPEDAAELSKQLGTSRPEDTFALMDIQEKLEQRFYITAGETLKAPAQRMTDFVNGKASATLPSSSYVPGLISSRVDRLLPPFISERLRDGFRLFGRRAKGFLSAEATVIGLESRTSSPVRLPRNRETMCHTGIEGLYPAGEGAGYAGGIVSAAIDGILCATALADTMTGKSANRDCTDNQTQYLTQK